jgi:hypothetical protein
MVVPFAAGGAFDVLGRVLAQRMAEILGQPVIVENVSGAGGVVGAVRVARGPADGSQFILGDSSFAHNQSLYKNPPFNAAADFAPVALIAEQPTVLVVRKEMPRRTKPRCNMDQPELARPISLPASCSMSGSASMSRIFPIGVGGRSCKTSLAGASTMRARSRRPRLPPS